MPPVTLAELKAQLNLDHDLDDLLLLSKIAAASAYVAGFIGSEELPNPVPATINQAILMLAAYWYERREAAIIGGNPYAVPFGVHELLNAHRAWVV